MRKALSILMILGFLATSLTSPFVYSNQPENRGEATVTSEPGSATSFRPIELEVDEEALDGLTTRERKDQLLTGCFSPP